MLPNDTLPTPVLFVCTEDGDADTIADAVVAAADAHYAQVERVKTTAAEKAAAENEALNASIAAALAAAVAKADAAAAALIAEEEAEAYAMRTRNLASKLAADAKAKLAAHNKTVALVHKRAVAAAESARAQQNLRESADRDAQRDRKLHQQRKAASLLPVQSVPHVLNVLPYTARLPPAASRFTELFARKKAAADVAFRHGYALFMSRFSLVPTASSTASTTDMLLFGEFDEDTHQISVCPDAARCSLCCERRATHMYVPCGHVCVCRDCAAACPWVCIACDVAPEMVLLLHGMPK